MSAEPGSPGNGQTDGNRHESQSPNDESLETLEPLELRDGPAPVVQSPTHLEEFARALGQGSGPVGIDAERASGYRYSQRAYLVQLRREGSGTALVDPISVPDLSVVDTAIGDAEWILHAATQDLPCLAEVGMSPTRLFDTELAGRLLGRERVSLAALVGSELGRGLAKGHGATDWSVRPLSDEQLRYAALDVEPLVELRDVLADELISAGRMDIAQQEFEHLLTFQPRVRGPEEWRRLSGMHKLRKPRQWALARELWLARDSLAERKDIAPGRLLPDSAIVSAVLAQPSSLASLLETSGFHGRGAGRYARTWWSAIERGMGLSEAELPERAPRPEGPPPPRTWAERNPAAHDRFQRARSQIATIAQQWDIAPELLIAPDTVRRMCWEPPPDTTLEGIRAALATYDARPWQIETCAGVLHSALRTRLA